MKTCNTIERDLNRIRLKIHEETKNLTPAQYIERYNRIGEEAAKKYGFTRIASAKLRKLEAPVV